MQLADLVLMGTVTDLSVREGISEKTGNAWRIETAYLVGPRQAYAVTLPDELSGGKLTIGEDVALAVYCRVYNGRVDYAATGLWSGELPAEWR